MADLVLTIRVPQAGRVVYGEGRARLWPIEHLVPLVTRVVALRRIVRGGALDESELEADAFIPEIYREQISGRRDQWITPEIRRSLVWVSDNRKSLAPFLESGELALNLEGDK
jgi:hypothetical protein